MKSKNYIYEYYQAIKDGSITVGKWVEKIYEKIVHGIENNEYIFNQKKAAKAINFIESKCHHSKGKLAPKTLKLELWQKALLSVIFGIVDNDGNRTFREVFVVMGRKNGKTLLASAIMEYMVFADGEYGADAFCLAPKVEQADIVYSAFWQSAILDSELKEKVKHRKNDIYIAETNSSVKKIALNAKTSDGFNPHFSCQDEIAAWSGDKGLKGYEVIKSGLGSRDQPIALSITTAGYENDSIYDELMKRSTRFLLGESKEKRLLPILYMIDDVENWNQITELQKSNPNLGISVKVDYLLEEIAVAEGSLSKRNEFLCKYCCIKQNSSCAWLDAATIEKACGPALQLEDFAHNYCVVGIDLSQTVDLTACVAVIEKDGILNVFARFFMPSEKIDEATARDGVPYRIYVQQGFLQLSGENFIDYHDCYNWLVELVEKYEILPLMCGYDRYSSQYLVQDLERYGFRTDDVYQGTNLTPVINEFSGLIKDGKIRIGDNNLLKMHFFDSAIKTEAENNRKRLIKLNASTSHIDGMAALLDALCVRMKWYDTYGEQLKNEG